MDRTRIATLITTAVACLAALPAAAPAATDACEGTDLRPSPANVEDVREATLCLINAEREERGLRALSRHGELLEAAQDYSRLMVRKRFFGHVSPGGSTLTTRVRRGTTYLRGVRRWALGENLAWGTGSRSTPASVVRAWMRSSGHRRNILNRRFRQIGIGVSMGSPRTGRKRPAATYTTNFGLRSYRR